MVGDAPELTGGFCRTELSHDHIGDATEKVSGPTPGIFTSFCTWA